jgi:hypothetical protein
MTRVIDGRTDALFVEGPDDGAVVSHGDLETFVTGVVAPSALLAYAEEASRTAKEAHGAEYAQAHSRKAALKVRSVWRDASAAGGYGHLVRNLPLVDTPACKGFVDWFGALFLR